LKRPDVHPALEEKAMKGRSRVAVLGLGDFGYHFACELSQLGHEVLAVDNDADKVQRIVAKVTKAAVTDVGDRSALEELAVASFDIVAVCLPERLETTVLLVHYLHRRQTPQILVKVANLDQAAIVRLVGATEVILPDHNTARKTAMLIHHPRAVDYLELGDEQMLVAARPARGAIGKPVGALALKEQYGVALLGVWRPGQTGPPEPPAGDRIIAETDILLLAGALDHLRELRKMK
jgi:trk system potassium uptake protein TrkA